MNRLVRMLVTGLSSATVFGGLALSPSVAHAQVVNVAPPAYAPPAPDPAWYGSPSGHGYGDSYFAEGWQHDARRAEQSRAWRHHVRDCERAAERGAPPWVLRRMRCPAY